MRAARLVRAGFAASAGRASGGLGSPDLGGSAAAVAGAGAGEASGFFEDGQRAVDLAGFLLRLFWSRTRYVPAGEVVPAITAIGAWVLRVPGT